MWFARGLIAAGCAVLIVSVSRPFSAASQPTDPRPLPDLAAFTAQVKAHLQTDEELQNQYTYLEKRQEIRISKLGKVEPGQERLFEVYPTGELGRAYRRLIAVNGVPVPEDELARRDEARRKFLADTALIRERETPAERTRRERKEASDRQKRQDLIDDVVRVSEIALVGRERSEGHETVVATLTPRRNAVTKSDVGKYFPKFAGRAWVSESDYQVVKVDLEANDSILLGWGFVGRVHEGSRVIFERRRVNNEVWLPLRSTVEVAGRTLLVRKFSVKAVTEFSEYKKFSVSTSEAFGRPPK
jgi:hypothetical protein